MKTKEMFAFGTQKGATKLTIGGIIGAMLAILVGLAVAPTVVESSKTDAGTALENASSTSATIVNLIPLIFFVGILVGSLAYFGLSA